MNPKQQLSDLRQRLHDNAERGAETSDADWAELERLMLLTGEINDANIPDDDGEQGAARGESLAERYHRAASDALKRGDKHSARIYARAGFDALEAEEDAQP
jgi:hypothetical protein